MHRVPALALASALAVVLVACVCVRGVQAAAVQVNIHLKLDAAGEAAAIGYDQWCHERLPSDDVWLATINQPHVTLYLTAFDEANVPELTTRLAAVATTLAQCPMGLNATAASGTYGMWEVINNQCLQFSSDLIVNLTSSLAVPNQPIPAWVYQLPEPLRSEKIAMIKEYGSPNVFSQFQPHVTLAYDNATADNFVSVFNSMPSQPYTASGVTLGQGRVGNWGTVLRGKDYADWPLPLAAAPAPAHADAGASVRAKRGRRPHRGGRRTAIPVPMH